jgi:hypothetical protein
VRPGTHVLDEHVIVLDEHNIAEIPVDDPECDELFMTAMARARQRRRSSRLREWEPARGKLPVVRCASCRVVRVHP